MVISKEEVIEYLGNAKQIELSELINQIKEKFDIQETLAPPSQGGEQQKAASVANVSLKILELGKEPVKLYGAKIFPREKADKYKELLEGKTKEEKEQKGVKHYQVISESVPPIVNQKKILEINLYEWIEKSFKFKIGSNEVPNRLAVKFYYEQSKEVPFCSLPKMTTQERQSQSAYGEIIPFKDTFDLNQILAETSFPKENLLNLLGAEEVLENSLQLGKNEKKTNKAMPRFLFNEKNSYFLLGKLGRQKFNHKMNILNRLQGQILAEDLKDKAGKLIFAAGTMLEAEKISLIRSLIQEKRLPVVIFEGDLLTVLSYFLNLQQGIGKAEKEEEEKDNLENQIVRRVGDLLYNIFNNEFGVFKRGIENKFLANISQLKKADPMKLPKIQNFKKVVNTFFHSSTLVQLQNQNNPLAEASHIRKVSRLGLGGSNLTNVSPSTRDIDPSYYGRYCSVETPEGQKIGLVRSLTLNAKVDENGQVLAPYYSVEQGKVTGKIFYLTAGEELENYIAHCNIKINEHNLIEENLVQARHQRKFVLVPKEKINFIDTSFYHLNSVNSSSIPFFQHNDAVRMLTASNMQKQAVILFQGEAPLVASGIESYLLDNASLTVKAASAGVVKYVDSEKIILNSSPETIQQNKNISLEQEYPINQFLITNTNSLLTSVPLVKKGEKVQAGQIIACGYNYEDAIVVNERLVEKDILTSLFAKKYTVIRKSLKIDKKPKEEEFYPRPEISHLDPEGIVKLGSIVKGNDILVSKRTPYKKQQTEELLLASILGEEAYAFTDSSFRLPNNYKEDDLEIIEICVMQKRKIEAGDKLTTRFGNKGVVGKIVPEIDMPFDENGETVDIIFNPLSVPSRMNIADKFHARNTGPYALVHQQPVKGRAQGGGQRVGEMEAWALEAHGATYNLLEMMGAKSDDLSWRRLIQHSLIFEDRELTIRNNQKIKNSKSLNANTFEPEIGGLFCPQIFGPNHNYQCACRSDRSRRIRNQNPVTNTLILKSVLPYLEQILEVSGKAIKDLVYFNSYIVLDKGNSSVLQNKQILARKVDPELVSKILEEIIHSEAGKVSPSVLKKAQELQTDLVGKKKKQIQLELNKIKKTLRMEKENEKEQVKLQKKEAQLQEELREIKLESPATGSLEKINNKRRFIQAVIRNKLPLTGLVLNYIPVLPAGLRPATKLEDGSVATTQINNLDKKIILANERLKHILEVNKNFETQVLFLDIIHNEKKRLQKAFDQRQSGEGLPKQSSAKSLLQILSGKEGILRKYSLGKRVDYSARSVVSPNPSLTLRQVGIPAEMALVLYKPFLISALLKEGKSLEEAKQVLLQNEATIFPLLNEIIQNRPVLLNRAPTLHRLGMQGFQPVLTLGKTIQLHPLVTVAFNADFDGDQMAVFLPLTKKAQEEIQTRVMADSQILDPKNSSLIIAPTQDIVLGIYYLTRTKDLSSADNIPLYYETSQIEKDYAQGKIDLATPLVVPLPLVAKQVADRNEQKFLRTTLGRWKFNQILPPNFPYYINDLAYYNQHQHSPAPEDIVELSLATGLAKSTSDQLKDLGFAAVTRSGISISLFDLPKISEKEAILRQSETKLAQIEGYYEQGFYSPAEFIKQRNNVWTEYSGARATSENLTQVFGMRGNMIDYKGNTIETPILSSLKEGLNPFEFFVSVHGAMKGMMDTALKTAEAGYLTRQL
ncbi:14172_t:CDS:10, partial [Funneliformis geosporum]